MTPTATSPKGLVEIRKYSNRRYYDASRSRHLTLEEIRDRVLEGYDIRVTDNRTSADITSKVLAQIILDLDTPKIDVFPARLLAQLVRVNDQLLQGFFEKFFLQAVQAFLDYVAVVESQVKREAVLPSLFPPLEAWRQAFLNPFAAARPDTAAPGAPAAATAPATSPPHGDLDATVTSLQRQLDELRARLAHPPKPRRRSRRSSAAP